MTKIKFILIGATVLICWIQLSLAESPDSSNRRICTNEPKLPIRDCPPNEEFQCCGACEQLTCDKRYSNVRCFVCPSDCYCKEGYIREKSLRNGTRARCIPIEKCPPKRIELSGE